MQDIFRTFTRMKIYGINWDLVELRRENGGVEGLRARWVRRLVKGVRERLR